MHFKCPGYIEIPEATRRLWLRNYPGEEEALRPRADGRLPDGYHQACKHHDEAGAELTAASASRELTAVTFTEEWKEIEVPAEYWEPNSPSDATLANSKIGATSSSPPQWRQYYGRPCFYNEQKFATWLSSRTSPAGAGAVAFGVASSGRREGTLPQMALGVAAPVVSEDAEKLSPRERAKAETAKRHQAWNERAIVSRMEHPEMSHGWIATKIAKEAGVDPETVRRVIMTKPELDNAARERRAAQAPSAR